MRQSVKELAVFKSITPLSLLWPVLHGRNLRQELFTTIANLIFNHPLFFSLLNLWCSVDVAQMESCRTAVCLFVSWWNHFAIVFTLSKAFFAFTERWDTALQAHFQVTVTQGWTERSRKPVCGPEDPHEMDQRDQIQENAPFMSLRLLLTLFNMHES